MKLSDAVVPPIPFEDLKIADDRRLLNQRIVELESELKNALDSNKSLMRLLFLSVNSNGGKVSISEAEILNVDFTGLFIDTHVNLKDDNLTIEIVEKV